MGQEIPASEGGRSAAAAAGAGTPLSGIVTDTSGPVVPGAIVALKTATGGNADGPKATEREPSAPQVCQPGPMEHGRNEVAPEIWTVIARSLGGSRQVLGGRHRSNLAGAIKASNRFNRGILFVACSRRPYELRAALDLNQDGNVSGRPAGVRRNNPVGPGGNTLDLGLESGLFPQPKPKRERSCPHCRGKCLQRNERSQLYILDRGPTLSVLRPGGGVRAGAPRRGGGPVSILTVTLSLSGKFQILRSG